MIDTILLVVLVALVAADLFVSWNEVQMANARAHGRQRQRQTQILEQIRDGVRKSPPVP